MKSLQNLWRRTTDTKEERGTHRPSVLKSTCFYMPVECFQRHRKNLRGHKNFASRKVHVRSKKGIWVSVACLCSLVALAGVRSCCVVEESSSHASSSVHYMHDEQCLELISCFVLVFIIQLRVHISHHQMPVLSEASTNCFYLFRIAAACLCFSLCSEVPTVHTHR